MLNLRENRDNLIRRAIESINETEVVEFEYEPSEIIKLLIETDNDEDKFKNRKLPKSKDIPFFSNSAMYLKEQEKGK